MLVTCYCDASFCPRTGAGGWACWLRSDLGRIVKAGPCPDYVTRSHEAELAAALAGIHFAVQTWPATARVLVRSDDRTTCRMLTGRQNARHPGARKLLEKVHRIPVLRSARWVKGHQGDTGNADAYINNRVDRYARAEMRRLRARIDAVSSAAEALER